MKNEKQPSLKHADNFNICDIHVSDTDSIQHNCCCYKNGSLYKTESNNTFTEYHRNELNNTIFIQASILSNVTVTNTVYWPQQL